MPFDQIIGQDRTITVLRRMLQSGKIPHALLFGGSAGIGKHTTARALAQALNCPQKTDDFCGQCSSCRKIANGTHPDSIDIAPEKNIIKIDQIRALQQNILFAPVEATWRVVLIDQAECMNKETANCLLKTLEEPPASTIVLLIAHSPSRLLPTVLSRCQKIRFAPLPPRELQTLLEHEGVPSDRAVRVVAHAHGSMHRARQLLDDSLLADLEHLATMLCFPHTVEQRLELAATLSKSPERLPALLTLLLEWLRDIVLCMHGAGTEHLFNTGNADRLAEAARDISPVLIKKKIARVAQLRLDVDYTINMQLGLESLLLA